MRVAKFFCIGMRAAFAFKFILSFFLLRFSLMKNFAVASFMGSPLT